MRMRAYLAREDGNVESALVLIPMLFLFYDAVVRYFYN